MVHVTGEEYGNMRKGREDEIGREKDGQEGKERWAT